MAEVIIEVMDYLKNDPAVQGVGWFVTIGTIVTIVGVIAVFGFVFHRMAKIDREMDERWRKRRGK